MAAPLRVVSRSAPEAPPGALPASDGFPDYFDRLLKLIPAEVIGVYLIGAGVIPSTAPQFALAVWAVVCLGLVVLVRARATADPSTGQGPQWVAVMVATVSFVIWVYAIGGPFVSYHLDYAWVGSLAVLLWTFVVPYFYKG